METAEPELGKKMSRGRFLELYRGALLQCGLDTHSARGASYNRLRPFMPRLGQVLDLGDADAAAVCRAGDVAATTSPAAPAEGPLAGRKVFHSAVVKTCLLQRFLTLWETHRQHVTLTSEGLLPVDSWSWRELQALHQATPWPDEVPDLDAAITDVASQDAAPVASEPPGDSGAPGTEPAAEPDVTSGVVDDASSSASDLSVDAVDLLGILPDPTAALEVQWFQQGSVTHVVNVMTAGGSPVPLCRDLPFAHDPASQGVGFVRGGLECTCKRCLSRMPRGLYLSLAEHYGWSS